MTKTLCAGLLPLTLLLSSYSACAAGPYYAQALQVRHDARGFTPWALNANGQIAGAAWGALRQRAMVSGANGQDMLAVRTPLDGDHDAWATGITDSGRAVGWLRSLWSGDQGFYTDPKGRKWTPVLAPTWATRAVFAGVNGNGLATGYASLKASGQAHAILGPLEQVAPIDLGTLGGSSSWGYAVDSSGRVVGESDTGNSNSPRQAFITGPGGAAMQALESTPSYRSAARAISDTGWVAGWRQADAAAVSMAFVQHPSIGLRVLSLPNGGTGEALGVDAQGHVVGWTRNAQGDWTAFVTEAEGGTVVDLNAVTVGLPRRSRLGWGFAINARGQIAAADTDGKAYLLCPTPGCL
ncbi:hypothetical protein KAK06_07300 [Ideonella sp. 4Y11]|uniref:HAF repeat-containing protein n=1 Tax=Ideonella aquatica TaxID=2824119 RepID=A0A940YMQ6_9BURK|nr:hypothetical protein [Ideonella aquatica]MBQ0958763.1 hypothetical protein [Ideonella aquatica]